MSPEDMELFQKTLANAKKVVVLCGAGLSAASGLNVSSPHSLDVYIPRRFGGKEVGGEITKQRN